MTLWLRSLLFNLLFWVTTIGMGLGCTPLLLAPRQWLRRPMRWYARLVVAELRWVCGIRLVIEGGDRLPTGGGALIAAKHQSAFDTVVWLMLVPDCAYVLKRELLALPIWGWYCRKMAMIAVDRSAGASAMRHLLQAGKAAAAAGRQIVIFPEGTRSAPGQRLPYQPGVVALATATGLPVVPVATDSGRVWGRRAFLKRPGTITISVLPPLPAGLRRDALLPRLEDAIEAETARLLAPAPVDNSVDSTARAVRP